MRRLLAAILLAACLIPGAGVAGFDDGVRAYLHGDYVTALRELRPLAEQGHALAQTSLGVMYQFGRGVPRDYAEAVRWYRKAAEQGYALAQTYLGVMYEFGRGVPRDYGEAVRWYRLAAEQGNDSAQFNLGLMYDNGKGVPRDYGEAVRWYRLAAEQGNDGAQTNLGAMYHNGQGVPRDYVESYKWSSLGAASGNEAARANLDKVERKMTPSQIAEAQRRAREWKPGTSPAVAKWPENRPLAPAPASTPAPALVAEAQRLLAGLGFDPGPADGVAGPRTRQAVMAYQRRQKIPADGAIDDALVGRMRAHAAAAPRTAKLAGTGTGFYVGTAGHVLTNAHVVEGCTEIRIPPSGLVRERGRSAGTDLALLDVPPAAAGGAPFRQGAGIRAGEQVVVAGYPLRGILASDINITTGNVSALAGMGDDRTLFQITAPVQPGNSGGPVLDMSGNVVGVVVGKLNAARVAAVTGDIPQNINFAVGAEAVQSFLDAQGVAYATVPSTRELKPADIAANARTFTVVVECWR